MLFNSLAFIYAFLPISLLGFFALARLGSRPAWLWIVVCSLGFYSHWNMAFLPLILASIAFNYAIARLIFATEKCPALQTGVLVFGVVGDVGALCYYKYLFAFFGFLRLHTSIDIDFPDVVLPLGISFFTFTQIGYLVDIKQGIARDRSLLNYVLFVTFFPHLIAGPILHNREMMPQFADPQSRHFDGANFASGVAIFMMGLFKKVIIADHISPQVALGFDQAAQLDASTAWITAVTFTFQLYFDFSGYTDMAIGLARMFNIRFPVNFNSPFKAASIIDYWQRWHMTLTRFTNMYIFTPMSLKLTRRWLARRPGTIKASTSKPRSFFVLVAFPLVLTMTVLGVWHGAGLNYLAFGVLNGVYLVINHAARNLLPKRRAPNPSLLARGAKHAGNVLVTCLAVLVAQVFFRAASVGQAVQMLSGMAGFHGAATVHLGGNLSTWVKLALLYAFVWIAPNTQQIMERFKPVLGRVDSLDRMAIVRLASDAAGPATGARLSDAMAWRPNLATGLAAVGVFAWTLTRITGISPFLYFQF